MTEEFISRTEALEDFESCNAENPNWTQFGFYALEV